MRVVVCVEDPVHRRVASSVVEGGGSKVTVETDRPFDAAEVAMRFRADVVIVDLYTYVAEGKAALRELDLPDRPYHLVVLTDDPAQFRDRAGMSACGRYDPDGLASVLGRLSDPRGLERRRPPDRVVRSRDLAVTFDPAGLFFEVLNDAVEGDVLVVAAVRDESLLDVLGKICRAVTRGQDFVVRQSREVAVFVPAGGANCGTLERIRAAWPRPEPLIAVSRVLGPGESPAEVFLVASRAVRES
jgi:CheY-like chemotaxis protein